MGDLYLPNLEQLLIIPTDIHKDMSDQEFQAELDAMFERSRLASRILNEGQGLDDLCDLMNDQKFEVASYLDALEECLLIS